MIEKFKTGDFVKCIHSRRQYMFYPQILKQMNINSDLFCADGIHEGDTFIVLKSEAHILYPSKIIVCVTTDNKFYLINQDGLELNNKKEEHSIIKYYDDNCDFGDSHENLREIFKMLVHEIKYNGGTPYDIKD